MFSYVNGTVKNHIRARQPLWISNLIYLPFHHPSNNTLRSNNTGNETHERRLIPWWQSFLGDKYVLVDGVKNTINFTENGKKPIIFVFRYFDGKTHYHTISIIHWFINIARRELSTKLYNRYSDQTLTYFIWHKILMHDT